MYSDTEVRDALRWIGDILDWSQIPFMVLGDLVPQMISQNPVSVDKIVIGIRKNAWNKTTQSLFKTFLPSVNVDELSLDFNSVPIELKIITRDYEFFKNPDNVFYWTDEYKIPNPWDKYYKARFLIK